MALEIRRSALLLLILLATLGAALPALAQQEAPVLPWSQGPATAPVGSDLAEIDLGGDYVYLDGDGTRQLMELTHNPVNGTEQATVAPVAEDANWFLVFEWDDIGYVPDDEKDSLDADAMLQSIREGTEAANEERRKRGWPTMEIIGWHEEPHYDPSSNNLSWAIIGQNSDGGQTINRLIKLLGRRGVMTVTLVSTPDELTAATGAVDALLGGYRFRPGHTYAEYMPSTDKLAQYGLTALVVGGAGAALVKSGLLAKLWKPLMVAVIGIGAALKRLFGGGRSSQHDPTKPIG